MPSSIALISFPLKSNTCKCRKLCNSLVENIGFKVSPNKLSASRSSINVSCKPVNSFSVILRKELPVKSTFLNGSPDERNSYNLQDFIKTFFFSLRDVYINNYVRG